ncbi:MAG: hypothetical protein ACI8W7_001042, partial [Gammaproteobacteria bacterium]
MQATARVGLDLSLATFLRARVKIKYATTRVLERRAS